MGRIARYIYIYIYKLFHKKSVPYIWHGSLTPVFVMYAWNNNLILHVWKKTCKKTTFYMIQKINQRLHLKTIE